MPVVQSSPPENTADIHVTKLAAARRQLCAAIRMFFAREDELAIHTVASAAYQLLKDLKEKRGRDEAGDNYLNAIFYSVRDFRRGTLPSYLANDRDAMDWICKMADLLPITASSKFKDFALHLSSKDAKEFWNDRNRIANFLKHADHDPNAHVVLQEVDNSSLLGIALCAYVDLTNDLIHPEGLILWMYLNAGKDMKESLSEEIIRLVEEVEEIEAEDRIDFCAALLKQIRGN